MVKKLWETLGNFSLENHGAHYQVIGSENSCNKASLYPNISQISLSVEPLFQVAPTNTLQSSFSVGHFQKRSSPTWLISAASRLTCRQLSAADYQVIFLAGNLTMLYP